MASNTLTVNGYFITAQEKTFGFRQGLSREDLQSCLILPARTEMLYEQLAESARSFIY